ncbi:hypothetical protein CDAR_197051 [Caerostris darwini]|uniref:Uncharacterized protein n=1 Tax=Caerostris darwini TaxID=1538125 RepID=A0AAV4SPG0_9ARAC|nr:hypothetical protein CDAR_197051 [Caerostris darwini]
MLIIETVLQGENVSVDVAVILLSLHFLKNLRYKSEYPAMNVTVHPPDFEEIFINCRLPSTYTRDCEKTCVQDASTPLS